MKWVSGLVWIAAIGAAGYLAEPAIQPLLVSSKTEKPDAEQSAEQQGELAEAPSGSSEPGGEPVEQSQPEPEEAPSWPQAPEWVASLTPEQLPEKVTLKTDLPITVPGAKQAMVISEGVEVTPIRVEGDQLVVSPLAGPLEGTLAVMATDLVDRLGGQPPAEPETETVEPDESPEPATPQETVMTEEETSEPEAPAPPAGVDIVKAMQDSIKAGDVKEFTFDQVTDWSEGEEVERDGVTYQSGKASYKAETIFGVKSIQAQALLEGGKVVKWIWPNSGMEIQ